MSRTHLDSRRASPVASPPPDLPAVVAGEHDGVVSLYRKAYKDHDLRPEGSELQFGAWLVVLYGGLPPPGTRIDVPAYEDMIAVAGLANKPVLEEAKKLVENGVTCTHRARVRERSDKEQKALRRGPGAGIEPPQGRGGLVNRPGAKLQKLATRSGAPAAPKRPPLAETDPELARLVEALMERPGMRGNPERIAGALINELALGGVEHATEALAERLGLPGNVFEPAVLALQVTTALFDLKLAPRERIAVSKELHRLSTAAPAHYALATREQIASVERALEARLDVCVRGRKEGSAFFKAEGAKMFEKGLLKLEMLRGIAASWVRQTCETMLAERYPELGADAARDLAKNIATGIERAVGPEFYFRARAEARVRLEGIGTTLEGLAEPANVNRLVESLQRASAASRRKVLGALGLPPDVAIEPDALARALLLVAQEAQAEREALSTETEELDLLAERYGEAVLATARRLGVAVNADGSIDRERHLMRSILEAGIERAASRGKLIRRTSSAVATIATAPFGSLFEGHLWRYIVKPVFAATPEILTWVAEEAAR